MINKEKMEPSKNFFGGFKNYLSFNVFITSILVLTFFGYLAATSTATNSKDVFNIVLPVLSSWVGTVLAFHFGRENYESAAHQMKAMNEMLTPEQKEKTTVSKVMIPVKSIKAKILVNDKRDINLEELYKFFEENTRWPIFNNESIPLFLIHQSMYFRLVTEQTNTKALSLSDMIKYFEDKKIEFGPDSGFIIVSETTTLSEIRLKLRQNLKGCRDVFVTKDGKKGPVLGWLTDIDLYKHLS